MRHALAVCLFCGLPLCNSLHAAEPVETADPRRPAAITTEGVPPIPAELVARLNQYQNIRHASFSGWSPDGKGILIGTRFGNSVQLHRVYEPGGRREQVTFFEEPVRGRFLPKTKSDEILFTASSGGNENSQIYYVGYDRPMLLTDGKSRNSIGPILEGGAKMIVSSNRRNGRDTDLYLADPLKPDSLELLLKTDGEFWNAHDWSPDGRLLLVSRYVSANESHPALLDVATKELTLLPLPTDDKATEEKAAVGLMAFDPDGKGIYLTTDAFGEFKRLARLDLATKKYEWLTADIDWDVSELAVDRKAGDIAWVINADGASRLFRLFERVVLERPGIGRVPAKPRELKLPLGIVSGLEYSPDGKRLGFTLARPNAPAEAYSLDLESDKLTQWTFSEVGGLFDGRFVTPSQVRFASFDGRQVPAYVYRPRRASKVPVLINIHGGPEGQYQPFFSSVTQYYVNELKVAVVCPNVRGSSGYGKTYLKLDNAELREDSVKDIGGLLDWIATQEDLDASRVVVVGGSYGGYMVLASLVHYGERIKAGVDAVGIANFITLLEGTAAYRQDLRRAEYGDERDPKMRAFFERINPSANAHKIRSGLLVVHGRNDPRVPFGEAQQIVEKVRGNGRPVWTVYADNEGHGFAKKDNTDYLRAVEVLFLKEHLGLE